MIPEAIFAPLPSNENPFKNQSAYEKAQVRIETSAYETYPEMTRAEFKIFGAVGDEMYDAYKAILDWLKLPYVHDNFGEDHLARREWFKTLDKEQNLEMLKNKFRNNPVSVLAMNINNLKSLLARNKTMPADSATLFPDNKSKFVKLRQTHVADKRRIIMEEIEIQCENIIAFLEQCVTHQKIAA